MTLTSDQSSPTAQQPKALAEHVLPHRWPRRTRRLSGTTCRLTQSETASLAWRIIAAGTKPGEAHGLLKAWPGWERLARRLWPVREIPGSPYGLLCLRVTAYRGETVILPDSTTLAPGAILGELHCNNRAILKLVSQHRNPFAACREDLKSLGNWLAQDQLGHQIEAFYGCTILTTAAQRLGFTVRQKPINARQRLEKVFFKGLLLLYNQEGLVRIQRGSTADIYPADVWLSRRELLRLYYDHNEPVRQPVRQSAGN